MINILDLRDLAGLKATYLEQICHELITHNTRPSHLVYGSNFRISSSEEVWHLIVQPEEGPNAAHFTATLFSLQSTVGVLLL